MRVLGMGMVAAALLIAACGGGGDDDRAQTISAPTSAPSSPTAPAAASTSGATQATAPATQAARGRVDLQRALLRLEDMPTGWTQSPPSSSSSSSGAPFCGQTLFEDEALDRARVDFQRDAFTTAVHSLAVYKDGTGKAVMDRALKVFESCTEWTDTASDGKTTKYRLSPLSFPKLGDQTAAIRMNAEQGGVVVQADLVYLRRGDVIALVGVNAGGLGVARVDSAVTEQLARKADQRLGEAQ